MEVTEVSFYAHSEQTTRTLMAPEAERRDAADVLDEDGHIIPMHSKYGHWNMDSDDAVCAVLQLGVFHNVLLGQMRLRDGPEGLTVATLPSWFWDRVPRPTQLQLLEEVKRVVTASMVERLRFE